MSFEKAPLRDVTVQYGARKVEKALGVVKTAGGLNQYTVDIVGSSVADGLEVAEVIIPAGSLLVSAYVEVTEAFVLGGTTPTLLVGTNGSEATNGVVVSEAIAEAVGTEDIFATAAGTWAASLAADTIIGVALGGAASPTVTDAGKARLVVNFTAIA